MANFPTSVPTVDQLHTGVSNLRTNLNGDIDAIQATITVVSTTGFPSVGAITIDAERISYTGLNATQFTGCTRGYGSTGAILHLDGAVVSLTFGAEYHNDVRDEVIAIAQNLSDRIGLGSTQVKIPDGVFGFPSLAFSGETNTGMYKIGLNNFGFTTNGVERLRITNTEIQPSVRILGPNGTVGAPSFSFASDTSTGFYRSFANRIAFSSGGNVRFDFGSNLVAVNPTATIGRILASDGAITTPGFSFANDLDTGLWRSAANALQIVAGGANVLTAFSTGAQVSLRPGSVGSASLAFFGDANTGIYSNIADNLNFTTGGVNRLTLGTTGSSWSYPFYTQNGSTGAPAYSFSNDGGMGMYRVSAGVLGFAAFGRQSARFIDPNGVVAGATSFFIYDKNNATVEQVTVGAANSGGSGYKLLRIPN